MFCVSLPLLLVLWSCTDAEATELARQLEVANVHLLARERFVDGGAAGLAALQRPLDGTAT